MTFRGPLRTALPGVSIMLTLNHSLLLSHSLSHKGTSLCTMSPIKHQHHLQNTALQQHMLQRHQPMCPHLFWMIQTHEGTSPVPRALFGDDISHSLCCPVSFHEDNSPSAAWPEGQLPSEPLPCCRKSSNPSAVFSFLSSHTFSSLLLPSNFRTLH